MMTFLKNIQLKSFFVIFAIAIIINVVLFSLANYFGMKRVFFNVDYFLVVFLLCYKNIFIRVFSFFVFSAVFFTDILLLVLQIYPFIKLNDLVYLSAFIFNGPVIYQVLFLSAVVSLMFFYYIAKELVKKFYKPNRNDKIATATIAFLLMLLGTQSMFMPVLSSNSFIYFKNMDKNMLQTTNTKPITPLTGMSASKPLFDQIAQKNIGSNRILYIVNESWGDTAKEQQQQAVLKNLLAKNDRLEFIHQGSFSVVDATVMGEVRELCSKQLQVMDVRQISRNEFNDCLPQLLKAQGFKTFGLHGADPSLYDRDFWYPLAGFQHYYFYKDLIQSGQCTAFNGRCDVLIIPKIKELLASGDKSFVYWMTLNTHAPYDDKLFIEGLDCKVLGIDSEGESCANYKLQYQFFTALSQLIEDPAMKGVEVYVVGDHAPPIINLKDGLMAFNGNNVAWIHFKIKGSN